MGPLFFYLLENLLIKRMHVNAFEQNKNSTNMAVEKALFHN